MSEARKNFKQIGDYPQLLTVEQAAEILQVTRDTVYAMIRRKAIPVVPGLKRNMKINRDALARLGVDGQVAESNGTREVNSA